MSRAEDIVNAHWDNYVGPLVAHHETDYDVLEKIKFHYISSGIHFYGHGREDERNGMES